MNFKNAFILFQFLISNAKHMPVFLSVKVFLQLQFMALSPENTFYTMKIETYHTQKCNINRSIEVNYKPSALNALSSEANVEYGDCITTLIT